MQTTWTSTFAWLLAASAAFALAWASPSESSVMGQLPAFMARTLDRQPVQVPAGLPAERTLALITFRSSQKEHVDGWVTGLNLRQDSSIAWLRMPVLNDPGSVAARSAIENKLLSRYPADERARMLPVFTNRDDFARSAGLNGTDQAYAVVVNRRGEVLARAGGVFDADKAQNLRETLRQAGL
ncbi:MAG: hypothetical protein C0428_07020 [Polaromonas sp.]|nr:hypothetical protein [Polaromonas sp.]